MRPCVKIFQNDLLNCMRDCIDILNEDFGNDNDAMIIVGELEVAINMISSIHESMMSKFIESFNKMITPLKKEIEKRNKDFFESIEICGHCTDEDCDDVCICASRCGDECRCGDTCIHCSDILTEMDSKTFKAIKKIMKKGRPEDVKVMFAYMDSFVVLGETYHTETKQKLS